MITGALCDRGGTHTDTSHPIHTPGSITGPGPPPTPPLGRAGRGARPFQGPLRTALFPSQHPPAPKKKRKITQKKKNHQKKKKEGSRAAARPESPQERAGSAEAPRRREQGACRGILLAQQSDPRRWVFPPRRCCAEKLLPELEPRSWGAVSDPDNPHVSVRTLMGRQGNKLRRIAPLCFAFRGCSRAGFKANSAPFVPFSGLGEAFLRQDLGEEAA